jgi:hypothetical protein
MTSIIAEKSMVMALKKAKERTQIVDSRGQILGFFIPQNHAMLATRLDVGEIERRRRSKEKAIPHKEVMQHMRLLDTEIERRRKAGERKLTGDEAVAFVRRLRTKGKKKQNC